MDKRIPFIIFVLAVAIDAFNGFLQYTLFIENPIGVIFRGTLWIYLLLSIIRIIELKRLLIICFFIILIISIWCIGYDATLLHEINYLIRYTYPIFLFCYFRIHWRSYSLKRLFKYSTIYATLISTIIIVCFILGIGHSSYGDNYGWGTTGLFIAQNDLSLTVVCGVIVSCIYYHKYCQSFLSFLQVFIVGIGGVLIGTRVCFIVIPFILAVHGHYVFRRYGNTTQKFVLLLLLLFFLPFIGWLIYLALDSYALAKLTLESIGNARTYLIDFAKHYIDSFNDLSLLIGKGVTNLQHYVARGYSGVEYRMVEADLYEIIGSYGFVLGGFVLFFYFFITCSALIVYFRNKTREYLFCVMLLVLYLVIGYFAGHAASNVMSAPIFALVSNHILTKENKRTVRIIKSNSYVYKDNKEIKLLSL